MTATNPFPAGPVFPPFEEIGELAIVRTRPRVGLHRLAQCVEAPTARTLLVRDEKYPSPFRTSYEPARAIFAEALRRGWDADTLYATAAERWWAHLAHSDVAAARRWHAMDAVEAFGRSLEALRGRLSVLGGARIASWTRSFTPLEIAGLRVADCPTVLLEAVHPGAAEVGVLSIHISKRLPHDRGSIEKAAQLLWELARANRRRRKVQLSPSLCLVMDVFSGHIADAGEVAERPLAPIERECAAIAGCWAEL